MGEWERDHVGEAVGEDAMQSSGVDLEQRRVAAMGVQNLDVFLSISMRLEDRLLGFIEGRYQIGEPLLHESNLLGSVSRSNAKNFGLAAERQQLTS